MEIAPVLSCPIPSHPVPSCPIPSYSSFISVEKKSYLAWKAGMLEGGPDSVGECEWDAEKGQLCPRGLAKKGPDGGGTDTTLEPWKEDLQEARATSSPSIFRLFPMVPTCSGRPQMFFVFFETQKTQPKPPFPFCT